MSGADSTAAHGVDVLVACVDDDARRIVAAMLRHEGWRVLEVAAPVDAAVACWIATDWIAVAAGPDWRDYRERAAGQAHPRHAPTSAVRPRSHRAWRRQHAGWPRPGAP